MIAATPRVVGIVSRWLVPELIDPPRKKGFWQPVGTKPADTPAFAMFAIEVFTGELSFGSVRHGTAILAVARRQRPEKLPETVLLLKYRDSPAPKHYEAPKHWPYRHCVGGLGSQECRKCRTASSLWAAL